METITGDKFKLPENETERVVLLLRDVHILFKENRELKKELEKANRKIRLLETDNEILKKEAVGLNRALGRLKNKEEEEEEDQTEVAFFIAAQRESMKLSFEKFGALFGVSGSTIKNYTEGKGSHKKARELARKIQEYRRKLNDAKKGMASTNKG